eukprot:5829253-Alexandrium_andersonii.AAC.1
MLAIMYGVFSATACPRGGSCNTVIRRNSANAARPRASAAAVVASGVALLGVALLGVAAAPVATAISRANSRAASSAPVLSSKPRSFPSV